MQVRFNRWESDEIIHPPLYTGTRYDGSEHRAWCSLPVRQPLKIKVTPALRHLTKHKAAGHDGHISAAPEPGLLNDC